MIASDLRLQLSYGMDALSTLKRLKVLNFVDVDQSFNKETIQWMISSWPRLGCVQGMLAPSLERNATLATILTNHGIHYSCA
ncbi:hypothetical protein BGX23_003405 [Mortierella sp. AD031]|nr:hypothetical protein BGX23_003405 [Mortierella sp. AD031]